MRKSEMTEKQLGGNMKRSILTWLRVTLDKGGERAIGDITENEVLYH